MPSPSQQPTIFNLSQWYLDHQTLDQWDNRPRNPAYYIEDCQISVPPLRSSLTESITLLSDPFVKQTRICSMQLKIRPCLHAACILSILIFWELTIKRLKSSFFWHKNFGPQNIQHMAKILGKVWWFITDLVRNVASFILHTYSF